MVYHDRCRVQEYAKYASGLDVRLENKKSNCITINPGKMYEVPTFIFIRLKVKTNDSGLNWIPAGTILPAARTKINAHINSGTRAYSFKVPNRYHGAVYHYQAEEVRSLTCSEAEELNRLIDATYSGVTNLTKAEHPVLRQLVADKTERVKAIL